MLYNESRTGEFSRNSYLEKLLDEINDNLCTANENLRAHQEEEQCKIFIVGPLRAGSTLLMQWLAKTKLVAYPTNLLSRFYAAPLIGAKIHLLLTDRKYNFRDEILDFNNEISYESVNGKTKGALSPNEFWYFWRRFLPYNELDFVSDDELAGHPGLENLKKELNGLANIFGQPFLLKAMIMNNNLELLNSLFDKALFIRMKRDPVINMQSVLEARKRQFGTMHTWYSFKIKEYNFLKDIDPLHSVAGQIYAINRSLDNTIDFIPDSKKIDIVYEEFCREPGEYFGKINNMLSVQDNKIELINYSGEDHFETRDTWHLTEYTKEQAINAYELMKERLSSQ